MYQNSRPIIAKTWTDPIYWALQKPQENELHFKRNKKLLLFVFLSHWHNSALQATRCCKNNIDLNVVNVYPINQKLISFIFGKLHYILQKLCRQLASVRTS